LQVPFEKGKQEPPFSLHARRSLEMLLRAGMEEREAGFARAWEQDLLARVAGRAGTAESDPDRC